MVAVDPDTFILSLPRLLRDSVCKFLQDLPGEPWIDLYRATPKPTRVTVVRELGNSRVSMVAR